LPPKSIDPIATLVRAHNWYAEVEPVVSVALTPDAEVGTFDAQYVGDEIHVTIPLSALGSNGNFNFKVESEVLLSTGVITQFLDIAPNAGLPVGIMLPPSPIG